MNHSTTRIHGKVHQFTTIGLQSPHQSHHTIWISRIQYTKRGSQNPSRYCKTCTNFNQYLMLNQEDMDTSRPISAPKPPVSFCPKPLKSPQTRKATPYPISSSPREPMITAYQMKCNDNAHNMLTPSRLPSE